MPVFRPILRDGNNIATLNVPEAGLREIIRLFTDLGCGHKLTLYRPPWDASSEPCCSRDQEQPCPDHDGSDGLRDALTGRCETFDGDG